MMGRLLDEDGVLDVIRKYYRAHDNDLLEIIAYEMEKLPPAQQEPKKGEWILMSDADGEYYACSECGEELPYCSETPTWDKPYPRKQSIDKTDFCPNCGADMRGKNNGKTT